MSNYSISFAIIVTLAACDAATPEPTAPPWMDADSVTREDQLADESELRDAWRRREHHATTGEIPSPPSFFFHDIEPSELEFVEYASIGAISTLSLSDDILDDTCEENLTASLSLAETEVWGYFINSAGETWRWRPSNPSLKMRRLRHKHAGNFLDRELDEFVPNIDGIDAIYVGEDDGDDDFRSVIGIDTRKIRSAYSGHAMTNINSPWMRIGGLPPDGFKNDFNNSEGTATKIGPRHLLTAGHNVWDKNFGFFPKDWWPGQDGVAEATDTGPISPNGRKNIVWYWIAPGWYEDFSNTQDYAVLILHDTASSAQFPRFGIVEDYALAGEWTWNFGIPKQLNDCTDSPLDVNGNCGGSMYGHRKRVRRTEVSYIFTAHDVQSGHSGGPVYKYNGGNRQIVGIIKSEYSAVENRSIRIRGPVFDSIMAVMDAWPSTYCADYGWNGIGCQ